MLRNLNPLKLQKTERLSAHLQRLDVMKEHESQFTGIFRRKKFQSEPKSNKFLNE